MQKQAYQYRLEKARQRSAGEPADYASHLHILDKRDQLIPFKPNRVQAHFLAHRTGRDLILKARQMGLSTAIQAMQNVAAWERTLRCATLAHDDVGTNLLRTMADRFWKSLPDHLRPERRLDNNTTTSYANGSEVFIATTGSKNKGRAGTYSRVHGSEVAFWADAAATMAGLLQGVPADGEITLESTPNGAQGWFYERCMEALDGESDWTLHFYAWWWDEGYRLPVDEPLVYTDDEARLVTEHGLVPEQIQWRRKKQRELGRLFSQEYPEDPRTCFLTSGNGYFADIVDLEARFSAPMDAVPRADRPCVAGLDFGQKRDYFCLSILDPATLEERELLRINQLSWSEMRERARLLCEKWHVRLLMPEINSMGSTNIEELHKEFARAGLKTTIQPFEMTAQSKPPLVTGFHYALDEGGLKLLPDPVGKHELNTFVASQTPSGAWKYEATDGGHDDTVVARMIAWHALVSGRSQMGRSIGRYA